MNQDKIMESQYYLRQVAEAIKKKQLSTDEAIDASTLCQRKVGEKLARNLPFACTILNGLGTSSAATVDACSGKVIGRRHLLVPSFSIVKPLFECEGIKESYNDEVSRKIAMSDSHPKLFRFSDALGGRVISDAKLQSVKDTLGNHADTTQFHILDWEDYPSTQLTPTHLTPIDKMMLNGAAVDKVSLIRENSDRLATWKQIHETIETVAADTMKDNGITF